MRLWCIPVQKIHQRLESCYRGFLLSSRQLYTSPKKFLQHVICVHNNDNDQTIINYNAYGGSGFVFVLTWLTLAYMYMFMIFIINSANCTHNCHHSLATSESFIWIDKEKLNVSLGWNMQYLPTNYSGHWPEFQHICCSEFPLYNCCD